MSIDHSLGALPPSVHLPGQRELPFEDGVPMESDRHRAQSDHLIDSYALATTDCDDVYVAGNMFVYFSPAQLKNEHFRGPDVFVVLGTTKKERLSWVLWEEWRLPDVVIEITSASTRDEDHGPKKRIYERVWKTAVYVLYDPVTHELEGYRLDAGRYVRIDPDASGDIDVHVLGLRLGLRDVPVSPIVGPPALCWIDASGAPLPGTVMLARQAEAEKARANGEKARADGERARADDEKARADDEKARAEKARADDEKARADDEKARADALAAELERLRGI